MKTTLTTLNEALTYHLEGLYDAEKKLQKAIPDCGLQVTNNALKKELMEYADAARDKRLKLKRIFSYLLTGPFHRKNPVIDKLLEETHNTMRITTSGQLRNVLVTGCIRHINHYKIAGYGTALGIATTLRLDTVADLLREVLEWEKRTDRALTKIAIEDIYREKTIENV